MTTRAHAHRCAPRIRAAARASAFAFSRSSLALSFARCRISIAAQAEQCFTRSATASSAQRFSSLFASMGRIFAGPAFNSK